MLHIKQFAVLKKALDLPEYEHILLNDGWILSYHRQLPVYHDKEKQITLLGHVWQVLPEKDSPQKQIENLPSRQDGCVAPEQLMAEEESWCGRYVLLAGNRVYLDAVGSLGVFYSSAGVSSEIGLLAEAMNEPARIYHQVEHLTWCPGPMTAYDSIFRLLPSQVYDYANENVYPRQLLAVSHTPIRDDSQLMETFVSLFCHSLRNMQSLFQDKKLLAAVTGGYDSRTVLALAVHAGLPIEGFRMEHDEIVVGDRQVPPLLCEKLGIAYTVFSRDRTRFDKARELEFIQHVGGTYHAKDRNYYAYHQYDDLYARFGDAVLIRGNIWEAVINSYRKYFSENLTCQEVVEYFCLKDYPREKEAMAQYFDWCSRSPQNRLTPRTRFDWEQNMAGCWMTEGEHAFDLYPHLTSVQPLNCRLLMTMLLDFSEDERFTRHHQTRITEYACPALAGIPYGVEKIADETLLSALISKTRRGLGRLKSKGLRATFRFYIDRLQDRMR